MIIAVFPNQPLLLAAAAALRQEPGVAIETYTAEEPSIDQQEPDTAISRIPLVLLAAALVTFTAMLLLQTYATTVAYPIGIGGRPAFAWPSFIPNAFEMAILSAILAGFAAFLIANRLPRLYDPIDQSAAIRSVMRGANVLTITNLDPTRARTLLTPLHPLRIEDLEA